MFTRAGGRGAIVAPPGGATYRSARRGQSARRDAAPRLYSRLRRRRRRTARPTYALLVKANMRKNNKR